MRRITIHGNAKACFHKPYKLPSFPGSAQLSIACTQGEPGNKATYKCIAGFFLELCSDVVKLHNGWRQYQACPLGSGVHTKLCKCIAVFSLNCMHTLPYLVELCNLCIKAVPSVLRYLGKSTADFSSNYVHTSSNSTSNEGCTKHS